MFPTTRWSEVFDLRDPDHPERRAFLERLARRYLVPVRVYLQACAGNGDEVDDLAQQFFATLFTRNPFPRLSPEKGSFRSFLRAALRNFVIDHARTSQVRSVVVLLEPDALARQAGEAPSNPETAFDRAWAQQVLTEAIERMRVEMSAEGRQDAFAVFESYCLGHEELSYQELAQRAGMSEHDVRNRLRECRQRLRALLRASLREYLGPHDDLEAELKFIQGA